METLIYFTLFIFFTILSIFFFSIKRKGIELIGIHTVFWLCILVISVTSMLSYDSLLTIVFLFLNTVVWIANILSMEV